MERSEVTRPTALAGTATGSLCPRRFLAKGGVTTFRRPREHPLVPQQLQLKVTQPLRDCKRLCFAAAGREDAGELAGGCACRAPNEGARGRTSRSRSTLRAGAASWLCSSCRRCTAGRLRLRVPPRGDEIISSHGVAEGRLITRQRKRVPSTLVVLLSLEGCRGRRAALTAHLAGTCRCTRAYEELIAARSTAHGWTAGHGGHDARDAASRTLCLSRPSAQSLSRPCDQSLGNGTLRRKQRLVQLPRRPMEASMAQQACKL